jgi:thiamine-monophosphate kinase
MKELELLSRIRARVPRAGGDLRLGIGDDCAIFRPPGASEDLLFTTDLTIEGVHFRRETHPAEAVGWRALARGLSDIAAMGGEPRFCLLSLALAPWTEEDWLDSFYSGFLELAERERAPLAGGDLGRAGKLACDVVVCGAVEPGKALRRDGARPGDSLWVSGQLGASALGLRTGAGSAWERHLRPEPRIALGRAVRECGASAAMDLSDGLSLDLHRLCRESGVAAGVDEHALPVYPGATREDALHGGEDYELLFTLPPGAHPPPGVSRIGIIEEGPQGDVRLSGRPLPPLGWDPFR